MAHVVAWELHHGCTLPAGMVVRHRCDNPPCTNPAHLVLGTHRDNSHDRLERGADAYNGTGFRHRTPDEVHQIRALHDQGVNMTEISRMFGCSRATVGRIVKGTSFQSI
ncbi:HNH endonuclease [Mycolicibacterium neoaurum]|uniref:HNH endonuclease n=1 Tax=Mycolicibacterium neoaurum TaxID=1795 RepID=UPI003AB970D5